MQKRPLDNFIYLWYGLVYYMACSALDSIVIIGIKTLPSQYIHSLPQQLECYIFFTKYSYSRESVIQTSIILMGQLTKHLKSYSSTCKHTKIHEHASYFIFCNRNFDVFMHLVIQHFTYPNILWPYCVWISDSYCIHYPARACTSRSYVVGAGVHLYVCIYDPPKV